MAVEKINLNTILIVITGGNFFRIAMVHGVTFKFCLLFRQHLWKEIAQVKSNEVATVAQEA